MSFFGFMPTITGAAMVAQQAEEEEKRAKAEHKAKKVTQRKVKKRSTNIEKPNQDK